MSLENLGPHQLYSSWKKHWQSFNPNRSPKRRMKVLIPNSKIPSHVANYQIPPIFVNNFDQKSSRYVQVSSVTMEKKRTTNVPISAVNDKRSTTATFSIRLNKQFLPMQLIYKGKTNQSFLKVNFLQQFSLSVNQKHFTDKKESLKFLNDVILPYI